MDDLSLALDVVRAGGAVAASYLTGELLVRYKPEGSDVVSDADISAEQAMVRTLREYRPADGVLAEEGSKAQGDRTWVVDPIDGTENFIVGDPCWCSAVALADDSGLLLSAVHQPATGDTFWAARGGGSWWNGRRMLLSQRLIASARLATFIDDADEELPALAALIAEVATLRMWGSGTMELAWLAGGHLDLWLQRAVLPWDWLPGALLVQEAGGYAGDLAVGGSTWSLACAPGLRADVVEIMRRRERQRPQA